MRVILTSILYNWFPGKDEGFSNTAPLLGAGVVDSTSVMEFALFVKEVFGI